MTTTNSGTKGVPCLQYLDENGKFDPSREPEISKDDLLKIYRFMVLCREADQKMLNLQRQGRIGTFPPVTGQEATMCAMGMAMAPKDWFVGTYREMETRLIRGDTLDRVLTYYSGFEEGSTVPADNRILPVQIVLGSQTPHAVGIAFAMKYKGEKDAAVLTSFGDGASSEGDVYEAMNFAGVWKVPIVFVCINNGWAISTPRKIQTAAETFAQKAVAAGFEGIQIDGNDPLVVYQTVREALEKARSTGLPTLIEAVTYRLLMHTTADDPTKYRDEAEVKAWWERDPLPRMRKYLETKGFWNSQKQESLELEVRSEIDAAVKRLEAPTKRKPDTSFDHVLGTRHPSIEAQRAEFLDNLRQNIEAATPLGERPASVSGPPLRGSSPSGGTHHG